MVLNSVFDFNFSATYNYCMGHSLKDLNSLPVFILVLLPIIFCSFFAAVMDFRSYCLVKNTTKNLDQIPLRASIISTVLFVVLFSLALILTFFLSHSYRIIAITSLEYFLIIVRNPLISLIAFRVNENNRFQNVESKRQLEISLALKAKEERKLRQKEQQENMVIVPHIPECNPNVSQMPQVSC